MEVSRFDHMHKQVANKLRKSRINRRKVSTRSQVIVRFSSHFFGDFFRLCRTVDSEFSHFPTLPARPAGNVFFSRFEERTRHHG